MNAKDFYLDPNKFKLNKKTQYNLPSSGKFMIKVENWSFLKFFEAYCAHLLQKSSFIKHGHCLWENIER